MNFLNRTDKIILSIALFIVAVFSYFMYDDSFLFKDVAETQQQTIGNINHLRNDVRLKSISAFAWRSAGKSLEVHQKDSVYTGEGSEVSIQLNDGSIININENSLVTLNTQNGETTLDLKYGDFIGQLNEDSKLKVTAGKEVYDLKGQKSANNEKTILKLNKSRSGQLDVKLQQGSADVKTKQQTKVLIKEPALPLVEKPKQAPLANIRLLVPDRSILKQLKDGDALPLSWSTSEKVSQFQVEVARDSLFKDIVWQDKTSEEKINAPVQAGDGDFYWRVKVLTPSGENLNSSPTSTFKIVRLEPPQLTLPEKNQILNFEVKLGVKADEAKSTFNMKWTRTKDSQKFHYQIASDAKFEKIIAEKVVTDLEGLSPSLPTGEYFVKVRAEKDPERFSLWSNVGSVQMTIHSEQRPPAPLLVQNKIEFNPATAEKRTPSSEAIPVFSWEKPKGVNQFKIQIGKTKSFDQAQLYSVNSDRFEFKDYTPGLTYFRVYSIGQRGITSLPSKTGELNVIIIDPKLNPLSDVLVNGTDPTLPAPSKEMPITWSPVVGAQKYLLEVDSDEKFKAPKKFEVTSTSVPIILDQPGLFHARVVALNQQGQQISHFSATEKFQYIYKVPLGLPSLLEPYDKTTVFMQQNKEAFLWLEWKMVKNIGSYQLEISTSPNFETIALKTETKEPRFLIKEKLPLGKLYWRVKALSENTKMSSDWTTPNEFSLLIKKNETYK